MKIQLPIAIAAAVLLTAAPARATTYDLTAGGQATINGAIFTTADYQATGTGLIDSFVRIQDNGNEEGYNATVRPVMPDVNTSPSFTHDLLLSAVGEATFSGVAYYEFLLDINQTNANPLLSLDQLLIYTRATALTSADELSDLTGAGSTLRYTMDLPANNEVLLNYSLNNGSGSGDMFVYVLKSLFGAETEFVYLYSQFGNKGGNYVTNDGFEEWAVRNTQITQVPDGGSTVALLGSALLGISMLRRRFAR
jgi:hypothetical protein